MTEVALSSFDIPKETVLLGLRAMKVVAAANGEVADSERALIESAARALAVEVDIDALEPIAAEDLAAAISEPAWRERLVQALVVMAVIDGEASKDEIAVVKSFADALGVDEPRVKALRHVMGNRVGMLRFDLFRRVPLPRKMVKQAYQDGGIGGAIRFVVDTMKGAGKPDPELAWRYKRLGLLPEGTLGREFWRHMTENRFALPGEPGGLPEIGAHHDLTHVLTGYDTDQAGEVQIASFYAGYYREDPFAFVWMVLLMFHLGIQLNPRATPGKGFFDPDKVLRALRRGAAINIDLTERWNYWDVVELPIDEVRRRYNILP